MKDTAKPSLSLTKTLKPQGQGGRGRGHKTGNKHGRGRGGANPTAIATATAAQLGNKSLSDLIDNQNSANKSAKKSNVRADMARSVRTKQPTAPTSPAGVQSSSILAEQLVKSYGKSSSAAGSSEVQSVAAAKLTQVGKLRENDPYDTDGIDNMKGGELKSGQAIDADTKVVPTVKSKSDSEYGSRSDIGDESADESAGGIGAERPTPQDARDEDSAEDSDSSRPSALSDVDDDSDSDSSSSSDGEEEGDSGEEKEPKPMQSSEPTQNTQPSSPGADDSVDEVKSQAETQSRETSPVATSEASVDSQQESQLKEASADADAYFDAPVLESVSMATVESGEIFSAGDQYAVEADPLVADSQFFLQDATPDKASANGEFAVVQDEANEPAAGLGTLADLIVLDYMSQQIIDEVSNMEPALSRSPNPAVDANSTFRRLDCLGREQVLVRRQHFTHSLFLQNEQRPMDEDDMMQWAMTLQRINLATFVLLVLRPQLVLGDRFGRGVPNRERALASSSMEEAARGFFTHVVPSNRRGSQALELLVDMQTQQWLMAADSEDQLQTMVAEARGISAAVIDQLLAIEPEADEEYDDLESGGLQEFDKYAVAHYRRDIGQRLSRISGGKLNHTRALYALSSLQRRVSLFVRECVQALPSPIILSGIPARQESQDTGFIIDDAATADDSDSDSGSGSDYPLEDTAGDMRDDGDVFDTQVSGDFEVTIYKTKSDLARIRAVESQVLAAVKPTTAEPEAADELEAADEQDDIAEHVAIDSSFLEERRVAIVIRDFIDDNHLDRLIEAISADPIDILRPQEQSHTPRRMRVGMRHHHASEAPAPAMPTFDVGHGGIGDGDGDFRLKVGEESSEDEGALDNNGDAEERTGLRDARRLVSLSELGDKIRRANPHIVANLSANSSASPVGKRLETKRRAADNDSNYSEHLSNADDSDDTESVIPTMGKSTKRGRIHYEQPAAETAAPRASSNFRGRRGIPAEDMSALRRRDERVDFTPSVEGTPRLGASHLDEQVSPMMVLGQYQPQRRSRNEPTQRPAANSSRHALPAQNRRRMRWSTQEEECFIRAAHRYGLNWSTIMYYHGPNGITDDVLRNRTRVHLKDKARNIKFRLIRENRPLGIFESATGHL
ncbi:hypothetical protein LPJ66_005391 [Kickxella alabastrina]|uniref:Uncharacterized protein n=1 Tax=Kickxella alabastrina TaxID=61397 RepID=A0ACC1IGZ1_9FUNG|nr:hypothetical protein LPJ66_005391 [Kickxella alabastrina]